jgi:hypothetical protein
MEQQKHIETFHIAVIRPEFERIDPDQKFVATWSRRGTEVDGPGWDSVEGAVAWGRVRAPYVLVRLRTEPALDVWTWTEHIYAPPQWKEYSVGEKTPQRGEYADWPGDASGFDVPVRHQQYGGVVHVFQLPEWYVSQPRYTAQLERHAGSTVEISDVASGLEIESAVEWSVARASNVVLGIGDPDAYCYSVVKRGDMPALDALPSW